MNEADVDVGARSGFLEDVIWRGAIGAPDEARAAVTLVLGALAGQLPAADAADVAAGLPPDVRAAFTARRRPPGTPGELCMLLSEAQRITRGTAIERMRAVCESLRDALDAERRLLLARRLPADWAALLESAPRAPAADEPHGTLPGHGHTLATGRPGSRHPLSESGPRPGQADSIATENPHGDSKLSSATAPGVEPLATARPGTEDTLATAKDERHEE